MTSNLTEKSIETIESKEPQEKQKISVVCMLWGNWCKPHGIDYVNRLYNMVERHLTIPHDFICLTDRIGPKEVIGFKDEIDVRYLEMPDWPLNFKKLFLYKPKNGLKGRILYIDLDSVIIGSIDEMASYNGKFCGVKPFNPKNNHTAGGLLSFEAGYGRNIWNVVSKNLDHWIRLTDGGNERFVYQHLVRNPDRWQDLYPGQFVSYRKHCRHKKESPPNARFIAFYAKLKPHMARERWIIEQWK